MFVLWSLAALCVLSWRLAGLEYAELGFRVPVGWRFWASFGIAAFGVIQLAYTVHRAAASPAGRDKLRQKIETAGKLDLVLPGSDREHRRFRWLALTAGTTEEIIFRGFLIGTIALFVPLWTAASVATLIFVLAHAYQGFRGMLRVLPLSALLAVVFVIGGSLWPAMLLHAGADLIGGEAARLASPRPPAG